MSTEVASPNKPSTSGPQSLVVNDTQVVDLDQVEARPWPHRPVALSTSNAEFKSSADGRFIRVGYSTIQREGYRVPRHRHNFEQIRVIVDGEVEYGDYKCGANSAVYFPEAVHYGPTTAVSDSFVSYLFQTQGPSWLRPLPRQEIGEAMEQIALKAEVDREAGIVRWPDGRKQDGYEAAWEQLEGQAPTMPERRYTDIIAIHGAAVPWRGLPSARGVEVKDLATFGSEGPSLRMWRIAEDCTLTMPSADSHVLLAVLAGDLRREEESLQRGTVVYRPPGNELVSVSSLSDVSTLISIEYPRHPVHDEAA